MITAKFEMDTSSWFRIVLMEPVRKGGNPEVCAASAWVPYTSIALASHKDKTYFAISDYYATPRLASGTVYELGAQKTIQEFDIPHDYKLRGRRG